MSIIEIKSVSPGKTGEESARARTIEQITGSVEDLLSGNGHSQEEVLQVLSDFAQELEERFGRGEVKWSVNEYGKIKFG